LISSPVKKIFRIGIFAALLSLPFLGGAQPAIFPDLLYYPLLENANNTDPTNLPLALTDASGNGTTGWFSEIDAADWVPNQIGISNALHFHGIESLITTTNNASRYSFTTNPFTVGIIIHPLGSQWLPLIGNVNSNNPNEYGWYVAESAGNFEIHFENNGQETVARQANLPATGWECATLAVAGTNVSICCNGQTTAIDYNLYNTSGFNRSAAGPTPLQFCELASGVVDLDGDLSALAIWGHALTFYEQEEWFNANMPNLIEELKLWGSASDSSYYSNAPATLAGNPVYTTGPDGVPNHALYLSGGQYISQPNYPTYPISAFGVSFWIKPNAITGAEDLFQWADDGRQQYSIQTGILGTSGVLYCRLWSGNTTWFGISSLAVQPNQWNHVEISWFGWQTNNAYPIFRINGVLDTRASLSPSLTYGGSTPPPNYPAAVNSLNGVPFNFGLRSDNTSSGGNPYQGAVSDIQLYVNGLSDEENSLIYSSMLSSNYTGHIGPPAAGSVEALPVVGYIGTGSTNTNSGSSGTDTNLPPVTSTNAPSGGATNEAIYPDLLYFPFLENSNDTASTMFPLATADATGNGTTGWLNGNGSVQWVPNQIGVNDAIQFDGSSTYLATTNNASLFGFTTNNYTIGLVLRPETTDWIPLLGNVNPNNPNQYGWYVAEWNGAYEIHLENNGMETVARQSGLNQLGWDCATISAAGTNITISLNGLTTSLNYLLFNTSSMNYPAPTPVPFKIGELAPGVEDFFGDLSAVAIWSHALSFYEQQEWYNANMPNLVEEWKLWGNANDTSIYSNASATLVGNPSYTTGPDGVANHALYLNGSQYITQPNYASWPTTAFGISFWIKPDAIAGAEDLFQWADDANHNYSIQTGILDTSGVLYCRLWAGGSTWFDISSLPVQPNVWNHVEISWFGWQTNNCYPIFRINGVVDQNLTLSASGIYGGQPPPQNFPAIVSNIHPVPFNFGLRSDNGSNGGTPYKGAVSDVQFYINGQSDYESSLIYSNMVNSGFAGHIGPPYSGSLEVLPNVNP
jgi:hypothetical protein